MRAYRFILTGIHLAKCGPRRGGTAKKMTIRKCVCMVKVKRVKETFERGGGMMRAKSDAIMK